MQDITLSWNFWKLNDGDKDMKIWDEFVFSMFQSKRQYFNLHINTKLFRRCFLTLTKFENLSDVMIDGFHMELEDLAALVNNLPKLEFLQTSYDYQVKNTKGSAEKLVCKKLKSFQWDINVYLNNFEPIPDFEDLAFPRDSFKELNPKDQERLLTLLAAQSTLKSLRIEDEKMINQNFLENVKFKLEKLSIDVWQDPKDVWKFLQSQKTLKELEFFLNDNVLLTIEVLQKLLENVLLLPALKSVDIFLDTAYFPIEGDYGFNCPANQSIEDIYIESETIPRTRRTEVVILAKKFFAKMPNLKKLHITDVADFQGHDLDCLNQLKHLENLTISTTAVDSVLPHLNLPAIKRLTIYFQRSDGILSFILGQDIKSQIFIDFLKKHRKLKSLTFSNTMIQRKVWNFIKKNLLELEVFKIRTSVPDYERFYMETFLQSDETFKIVEKEKYEAFITLKRI